MTVDPSKFKFGTGSILVTLNKEYIESLEPGTYKLAIVSVDGRAETTFTVVDAKADPDPTPTPDPDDGPATGDSTPITLWAVLMALSGLMALAAAVLYAGKKKAAG